MDQFNRTNRSDLHRAQRPVEQAGAPMAASGSTPSRPVASRPAPAKKQLRGWKKIALIVAGLVVVGGLGYLLWNNYGGNGGINTGRYQAVFLTNGQVYFGKLSRMNGEYYQLTDIYYMQATSSNGSADSKNPQQTSQSGGNVQIVKLGEEIHGPEDKMIIGKDQVLFYENLKTKDGSKVVSAIADYKAGKK